MRRRGFLGGLLAVAVAPALPALPTAQGTTIGVASLLKAKAMLIRNDGIYGRSPAYYALGDMVELNKRFYKLIQTMEAPAKTNASRLRSLRNSRTAFRPSRLPTSL